MAVVFPHLHEIQRAKNKRFEKQLVCKNPRESSCHESLAKADNIGKQDAAALLYMVGSYLHGLFLKFKELISEILRDTIANDSFPRFLGEMVSHFDVDVVRWNRLWTCPALVNDVCNFVGNVQTPLVAPPVVEPPGQLLAGIVIRYINVQFALFR